MPQREKGTEDGKRKGGGRFDQKLAHEKEKEKAAERRRREESRWIDGMSAKEGEMCWNFATCLSSPFPPPALAVNTGTLGRI